MNGAREPAEVGGGAEVGTGRSCSSTSPNRWSKIRLARRPEDTDTVGSVRSSRSERRFQAWSFSSRISAHGRPSAAWAPMTAPMLDPPMWSTGMASSSRASEHADVAHAASAAAAEHEGHRRAGQVAADAPHVGTDAAADVVAHGELERRPPLRRRRRVLRSATAQQHQLGRCLGQRVAPRPPRQQPRQVVRGAIALAQQQHDIGPPGPALGGRILRIEPDDTPALGFLGRRCRDDVGAERVGELLDEPVTVGSAGGDVDGDHGWAVRLVGRIRGGGEAGCQQHGDARGDLRCRHERLEVLRRDADEQRITGDDGGPRAATAHEQRSFAERDTWAGVRGAHVVAIDLGEEADPPGDDAVHAIRRISDGEQARAGVGMQPLHLAGERTQRLVVEPGERDQLAEAVNRVLRRADDLRLTHRAPKPPGST